MASNWLSYQDCYNFIFHGKMVTQQSQSILFFFFFFFCCCSSYPLYFTFYKCLPASEDMYICVYIYLLVYIYTELRVLISYIVRCFREENFYFSLLPAISDFTYVLKYVYNSVNAC